MGRLFDHIKDAIAHDRFVVGRHAAERLRQRRIPIWQVVGMTLEGRLLQEREAAMPNPVIEVGITLADGTEAKAVWAWLPADDEAKLVTVHFFDR